MSEDVFNIVTEYRCPKPDCNHFDGGAKIVKAIHASNSTPEILKCKTCGGAMVEVRCWGEPFQRNFE